MALLTALGLQRQRWKLALHLSRRDWLGRRSFAMRLFNSLHHCLGIDWSGHFGRFDINPVGDLRMIPSQFLK
jgi:hypothetical protein